MRINLAKLIATWVVLVQTLAFAQPKGTIQPVDYVNPYMGNISHLLVPTYPTIHLPNSMLRVCPQRSEYTADLLQGLPIILTSHRGSFAFNFSPFQGDDDGLKPVIFYSYDQEIVKPYLYSVYLDEQQISVNYAVSHQSAIYRVEFSQKKPVSLIFDTRKGEVQWDGKSLSGYQELANNTNVYLYLEPDILPSNVSSLQKGDLKGHTRKAEGENANLILQYPANTKEIKIRYGISFIDVEQAKKNLRREIVDFDFSSVAEKGRKTWNEALGKITVEGGSYNDKVVFYTSLYRTYERPVCISEDGRYFSAFDGKVHEDNGVPFYTDDWIWDTYRAAHPLRIFLESKMESDIIHSFLRMSEQMSNFWWPTFPQITGDARSMNCNHGVATVLDAYRKGLRNFDLGHAYEACKKAVMEKTLAPWSAKPAGELDKFYHKHGYIPALREGEKETIPEVHSFEKRQAVAVTLGTSYDEWCLAQIAKELGKTGDYQYFIRKSYNYRNLFNPETGFFHPKDKDGNFIEPFDYRFSGGMGARDYYDENNGWTYRWDVQHNVGDLINLMGGREKFVKNLDQTFREPLGKSKYEFYAQLPDQTGNVGQFSMGNEPSFHIPYLYNYAGQPWKTQKRIRSLLRMWFRNDLMGIPGDEDGGGMSAFVVFSQMGFYPVTPGMPVYSIGSPFFEKITINLSNGKQFIIIAKNCSEINKYIQSAKLNGKPWNKCWFSHTDIMNGGTLELVMGDKANPKWGNTPESAPSSESTLSGKKYGSDY
jgi:predicted alpha-1,2-mannosidase